jgi:hypothetical protein
MGGQCEWCSEQLEDEEVIRKMTLRKVRGMEVQDH